jgi:hypothetical protein
MVHRNGHVAGRRHLDNGGTGGHKHHLDSGSAQAAGSGTAPGKGAYSKIFRWRRPEDEATKPATVEIIGTFTKWQKVALLHDGRDDSWQVTVEGIPANKTHHYILLVDGKPTTDKGCDGYAMPHGAVEEQYAVATPRGARLCMLFAQAK